ncbi:MAG: PH domain-containing protein [Sphingomonadaceae bacterium]|nr:PH domain-containing protein [Sphingomonadaceae bacterium]
MVQTATPPAVERHLHPLSLLVALPRLGPQLFGLLPLLVAISFSGRWAALALLVALTLILSLGAFFLRWRRFVWLVDADAVTIRQGLWSRSERVIPIERIQDVAIEQGLFHRLLGLAIVSFESGGGGEGKRDDARIDAISLADAQQLREQLRQDARQWAAAASAPSTLPSLSDIGADSATHILHRMGMRRLLLSGLFNFSLAAFGVIFGLFTQFDRILPYDPFDFDLWLSLAARLGLDQWVLAHRWLAAVGGLLVVGVLGALTGIIRTLVRDWDFTLSREPRGLRRTRGLTTRTDMLIPRARVQAAIISSGPVRRFFGYYALHLQNLASDSGGDGKAEVDHLVAPCVTLAEVDVILADVGLTRSALSMEGWARPHIAMLLPVPLTFIGIAAIQAAAMGYFAPELWWVSLLLLASAPLAALTGWLDWRLRRWRFDGHTLETLRGWWRSRQVILPARHVQSADLYISPLRRSFGLADLLLGVPGGKADRHRLSYISAAQLHRLRTALLTVR